MGEIIYTYGAERYGVVEKREKTLPSPVKPRRQQEINRLVKDRKQLKKQ